MEAFVQKQYDSYQENFVEKKKCEMDANGRIVCPGN